MEFILSNTMPNVNSKLNLDVRNIEQEMTGIRLILFTTFKQKRFQK
ncbi:hypothetical protein VMF7928_02343 [Vibrio marisflavi CECT 7928]|uniref:Uncharacterized protein n=1 Tax=Vibrio marisflavi CECT 7928 TaxID=634439 RepID=A0ABM9A498_9VIBR|nr:hypothetical protein VMF7928_02343 [Vibrio marisflavi CECT 7928]